MRIHLYPLTLILSHRFFLFFPLLFLPMFILYSFVCVGSGRKAKNP
jgi:hypothetical protein